MAAASASASPTHSPHPSPGIWASIAAVFRQNRIPCLGLNVLVASLVASYYFYPPAAGIWQAVGALKTRWSFLFSCFSTIFSAVLLPSLIQALMGALPKEDRRKRLIALAVFWGYRGMEIDLLYRLQGWLFGQGNDFRTLATKVAVDQLVYSTLWSVPTYVVALRYIDMGCSWAKTRPTLNRHFWTHTVLTILFTNWLIWIPTVTFVYSLPGPLQFPLFSVVMCFFILVTTLLARPPAV